MEFLAETEQQPNNFIRFPERVDILEALCNVESYAFEFEPLFALVAERLANKAYDRSAFVFILIELIYEFEMKDPEFGQLLSQSVMALTDDIYLAGSALDAYQEVKITLAPVAESEGQEEPSAADSTAPKTEKTEKTEGAKGGGKAALDQGTDPERLMVELQRAQKRVMDLGFSTRMSIEMTLGRPDRRAVRGTLKQISSLRASLREFEEQLRASEERILQVIGVLEEGP